MSESEKLTEIYKSKYQKIILVINNLKIGIRNIYDNLGCKSTDLDILKTGVSDGTMLLYLAKIELRTNEILQMYDICQAKVIISIKTNIIIGRFREVSSGHIWTTQK